MLEQLFGLTTDMSITMGTTVISMLFATFLGVIISVVYYLITSKKDRSVSFMLSMVLLPAVVAVVIILVGSNDARAFSIAGIFALVRFRSAPGDGKDISLVFLAMAAGLASGLGYLSIGFVVVVLLSVIVVLCNMVCAKVVKNEERQLRILIPEDMDYIGAFDDLFETFTTKASLDKIKTTNMGTLYELTYHISMKELGKEKEFMDAIRCRNGNLTVVLSKQQAPKGEL